MQFKNDLLIVSASKQKEEEAKEDKEEGSEKADDDDDDKEKEKSKESTPEPEPEKPKKKKVDSEAVIDLASADTEKEPRALHKTSSIFLRNLAPTITKAEVEAVIISHFYFFKFAFK